MNTFLFAWNPKRWDWAHLSQTIETFKQTSNVQERWSCASHKSIRIGDRAFLVKLGTKPAGIMASGFVVSKPFLAKHWSGEDKMVQRVMLNFDVLLDPKNESILSIDLLRKEQTWTPQISGISIKPEVVDELEAAWFNFLATQKPQSNLFITAENETQEIYSEGTPSLVTLTRYERNPYARKKCIDYYGLSCIICDFNFEKTYGQIGKDYIHVHHLQKISTIGKTYEVDPIRDLRPVCPNCHAIIHKRKNAFTIDEMTEILNLKEK